MGTFVLGPLFEDFWLGSFGGCLLEGVFWWGSFGQNEGTIVVQPAKIFSAKYTKKQRKFCSNFVNLKAQN